MKERKLKDISDLILRLSAMQYLDITESQYPVVTLNELSWQVLRGQKKGLAKDGNCKKKPRLKVNYLKAFAQFA